MVIHCQDMPPDFQWRFFCERFGLKAAQRNEVVIEVAHPSDREVLHPTELLAQLRDGRTQLVQRTRRKGSAPRIKFDRILVTVNVMTERHKPLAGKMREAEQTKGIIQGTVKACLNKIP